MEIRIIDNKKNTHPNILYKYRNWDNELHKKVLTDNILYMASPRDFEDIHDCKGKITCNIGKIIESIRMDKGI